MLLHQRLHRSGAGVSPYGAEVIPQRDAVHIVAVVVIQQQRVAGVVELVASAVIAGHVNVRLLPLRCIRATAGGSGYITDCGVVLAVVGDRGAFAVEGAIGVVDHWCITHQLDLHALLNVTREIREVGVRDRGADRIRDRQRCRGRQRPIHVGIHLADDHCRCRVELQDVIALRQACGCRDGEHANRQLALAVAACIGQAANVNAAPNSTVDAEVVGARCLFR